MNGTDFSAVIRLAGEKLRELGALRSELDRFIEAEDITAKEISAVFERTRLCMERIRQIDRQISESSSALRCEPELARLLEDQRALARKIMGMTRIAYEKAERASADCRTGLSGVQQRKWILAQFAANPIEPGSLLDYSEKICSVKKK